MATIEFGDKRLPRRFWRKVRKSTNGCWHWTGHITASGYGQFGLTHTRPVRVHRYLYDELVEPVYDRTHPDYREVDHECHNRSKGCRGGPSCLHRRCVNPAHLAAKSPRDNTMASPHSTASLAVAAVESRTHCPRGHPYSGENLYIPPSGKGRRCRICAAENDLRLRPRSGERRGPKHKTHCKRGHELSGANVYTPPGAPEFRQCRACKSERGKRRYEESKAR
jgi:hypothetical protein